MEELYRQNADLVYHFLYSKCRDRSLSEDLTQETFLRAMQSIERYDGSCKISVWLCQIAKHLLYQHWEKHRREVFPDQDDWMIAGDEEPERQLLSRFELLDVFRRMQELPDRMREVMYLRISGELSFREIGEILGKSENWARVTFFRGKELLKKLCEEADENDGNQL